MTDTVLYDNRENEVRLTRPPCVHMGERTSNRAKMQCKSSTGYAPVYRCEEYRWCSPFARVESDADFVHTCQGCTRYQRQLDTSPEKPLQ